MSTLELQLGDGATVFVDVQPSPRRGATRLEDVAAGNLEADFSKVSASLAAIVRSMEAQLEKLPRRPDTLTLEMGAELKGEADLWLVSGEAAAHMKVTMTWETPADTRPSS